MSKSDRKFLCGLCVISPHTGLYDSYPSYFFFHLGNYTDEYEQISAKFHHLSPWTCLFRYRYSLSGRTWLEYWPTDPECLAEQHRPTCLDMEQLVEQQQLYGCSNWDVESTLKVHFNVSWLHTKDKSAKVFLSFPFNEYNFTKHFIWTLA